ncbi:P-loop containing nucleoside triphosphate hydrolase protein [Phakopsora pachyrhizi]|nr:P-loop containing nucleoside triphosphate hydrolase protein [Phakopsora pachyrhizi]
MTHRLILETEYFKDDGDDDNRFAVGIAWPSGSLDQDSVMISIDHILSAGIDSPGDLIRIVQVPNILPINHTGPGRGIKIQEAKLIVLQEIDLSSSSLISAFAGSDFRKIIDTAPDSDSSLAGRETILWLGFVREVLADRKFVALNHCISVPYKTKIKHFIVSQLSTTNQNQEERPGLKNLNNRCNNSNSLPELLMVTRETNLRIKDDKNSLEKNPSISSSPIEKSDQSGLAEDDDFFRGGVGYDEIAGLDSQVEEIRELVELPLRRPDLYSHFGLNPPRGILLYGPPGTGKTFLASIVARSINASTFNLSVSDLSSSYHGEAEKRIYEIFEEARLKSPSVIIIDEIDGLFPNRDDAGEVDRRAVGTLLSCMDGLEQKRSQPNDCSTGPAGETDPTKNSRRFNDKVIVIATTNRPNAIDPALRRPGRFDRELEIGIPDREARLKILRVILRVVPNVLTDQLIRSYADRTHGFVGADLISLVRTAGTNAIKRSISIQPPMSTDQMRLESQDLDRALLRTRASAMREVFLETPRVKWQDIGGQDLVKQKLRESVEWPILHSETFKRLGIVPTRGVLLYGPPGCSKTLIAKALASESGLNFISIKGSDVFNKYLGESEKAIRDLFRKARMASPSVVFLDEIDSIGMSRQGLEGDESGGGGGSVGDRVLNSLLTEMDGIEELTGVLVLAATNRPEVIDSALMRPGRIDRILYVGPPDFDSRKEIFLINFKKMSIGSDVDVETLSQITEGCTGAEIVSLCQEAALRAMHRDFHVQFV